MHLKHTDFQDFPGPTTYLPSARAGNQLRDIPHMAVNYCGLAVLCLLSSSLMLLYFNLKTLHGYGTRKKKKHQYRPDVLVFTDKRLSNPAV